MYHMCRMEVHNHVLRLGMLLLGVHLILLSPVNCFS